MARKRKQRSIFPIEQRTAEALLQRACDKADESWQPCTVVVYRTQDGLCDEYIAAVMYPPVLRKFPEGAIPLLSALPSRWWD